jgi:DNA-binding transcriptional ArsR family regulator
MDFDNYEEAAKLFKALNHPARLAILDILREDEACVCHLEAHLGLRQAYISQQLMILREAGLVQDRRDGWNIFYRVSERRVYSLIDAASQITKNDRTQNSALSRAKSRQITCDCPKCKAEVTHRFTPEMPEKLEIR